MSWIVFGVLAALYWVTGRKRPSLGKGGGAGGGKGGGRGFDLVIDVLRELMLFAALCSLVFASLPFEWGTVGSVVGGALTGLVGLFGLPPVITISACLLVAVAIFLWDVLADYKVDWYAHIALIMMPFLIFAAAGPVTEIVTSVVTNVNQTGTGAVSSLLE